MKTVGTILLFLAAAAMHPAPVHAQPEPTEPAKAFSSWSEIRIAQATIPEQAVQADSAEPVVVKIQVTNTSRKPDGLPIYGAIPGALPPLPDAAPTAWGRYRVSNRPSRQIEHVHHIISAGYLR